MNADHAEAVAAIGAALPGGGPGAWRMVALDPDGAELALGERVLRLNFNAPQADPGGVRAELIRASREARAGSP
jgi:putative heme iron utilization protein